MFGDVPPFYSSDNVKRLEELLSDEEERSKVIAKLIIKKFDDERQEREKKFGKFVYPAPKNTRFLDEAGTAKYSNRSPYR